MLRPLLVPRQYHFGNRDYHRLPHQCRPGCTPAHALLVGGRRAKLFESGIGAMGQLDTPRPPLANEQMALAGQSAAPTALSPVDQEPRSHGSEKPDEALSLSRI